MLKRRDSAKNFLKMKTVVFTICLFSSLLVSGQNDTIIQLTKTDWKLCNTDSFPYSGIGAASDLHNFDLDGDTLTLVFCYIQYHYKIEFLGKDSLVLRQVELWQKEKGKKYVFKRSPISEKHNQFNDTRFLSFKRRRFHLLINDSIGTKVQILNQFGQNIPLQKKSKIFLEGFIEDNRYNDSYTEFFIFETEAGNVGLISQAEEIVVEPIYKKIEILRHKKVFRNKKKHSIPILCTKQDDSVIETILYYQSLGF